MFNLCNVIFKEEEDYQFLIEYLGNYPISFFQNIAYSEISEFTEPTIIIGWEYVKELFSHQNILDKKVNEKLFWTFSKKEVDSLIDIQNDISIFFEKSIMTWLPSDFTVYDYSLSDISLDKFFSLNFNKSDKLCTFVNNGAMYICQNKNNFIVNLKSLQLYDHEYKIKITNFLNEYNSLVFSYKNIQNYVDFDLLNNVKSIEILRWVKNREETKDSYFSLFPNFDSNKYAAFIMSMLPELEITDEIQYLDYQRSCIREKATRWMSNQYIPFSHNFKNDKLNFFYRKNCKLAKINFSNKKTITGRIVADDVYNPQNLQKNNDDRSNIISQFDKGQIFVFDYESFETRLALYLSKDISFISQNYNKDIHIEAAKIIFSKNEISNVEREFTKLMNHSIIYNSSEASVLKKMNHIDDYQRKYYMIKEFLKPILSGSKKIDDFYKKNSFVVNSYNTVVFPEKDYAAFNNYIQSTASEIVIDKVLQIKNMLDGKLSKFLFQVHDSLIFDICHEESYLINEIKNILSNVKNAYFPVSIKKGKDFKNLSDFNLIL